MKVTTYSCNLKTFCDVKSNFFELDILSKAMVLCNDSFVQEAGTIVGDPTETALFEFAKTNNLNTNAKNDYKRIYEIAFDSERKLMSTVNVVKNQNFCFTKGAFDKLIKKCKYALLNGKVVLLDNNIIQKLTDILSNMTSQALRVLAFAFKSVDNDFSNLENDLIFVGLAGLIDPPRANAKEAIKKCFEAGLTPIMITGDHPNTAFAISKELNIAKNKSQVITGEMLDNLSDKEFLEQIDGYKVFARVSPQHKVRIVKTFKQQGKIVAMTGDGVNDAPSLKIADIGVGMGITGTDVTKSVADMIVTDDNFATIVTAVEEGRKVFSNIQKTIQFLLSTNIVEVLTMFLSIILFPNFNYLFPAQLLFINLVTDSLPAFSLGVEKAESDVMSKKPRKSGDTIFSGGIGRDIIWQSIVQTLIVMLVFVWGINTTTNEAASTMVFMIISFMQLFHSINCKSQKSIFKINIFSNKIFNICFCATLLLNISVFTLPVFHEIFNIAPLNFIQWLVVALSSVMIIPIVELGKVITKIKFKKPKLEKHLVKQKHIKKV